MRALTCLPTYNEEVNIAHMINNLNNMGLDFVVCDGFSTDDTVSIAESLGAKILTRQYFGKGSAIIEALKFCKQAGYDKLVTIDCDLTYPVDAIPDLIRASEAFDLVVGRRSMQDIAFLRRWANRLMNACTNILFNSKIRDVASGMRVIDVSLFSPVLDAKGFDIEPQITAIALRNGYSIKEIQISYFKRQGKSKIGLKHLFHILWRLYVERFRRK